jgi:ADP-heptose:LPS heptosyltransferase
MVISRVAPKEKILVVRVGLGGDLVMITPALRVLLDAFPQAEFHLLTTGEGRRVLGGFSDRITQTFLYHRRFLRTQLLQRKLKKTFKPEGYSRIYVFEKRGFYRSWLQDLAPDFHGMDNETTIGHYSERCMQLVENSLDKKTANSPARPWISLPVTDAGVENARAQLAENGIDSTTKLVGLHPTFSGSSRSLFRDRNGEKHRTWPRENFATLARILHTQAAEKGVDLAVVIDALPEERPFIEPIVASSEGGIILMTSPPDFQRFKGYLQALDVLVSPNTGPMHFAAALGTHLVSLFSDWAVDDCGPFVPPERFVALEARNTENPGRGLAAIEPRQVADAVWRILP